MLKVLGLGGSPRKRGNTDLLLDRALAGAASAGAVVEKIVLNRLRARPCQECGSCNTTGICRYQDDMQALYPKLEGADGIILASPIFFMGLSAQAKTIIDRCQALWARKHLLGRPIGRPGQRRLGLFIAVAGTDRSYTFRPSITTVKAFFATLGVAYYRELLFGAVDARGEILQRPTALEEAFQAGVGLVRALLVGEEAPPARVQAIVPSVRERTVEPTTEERAMEQEEPGTQKCYICGSDVCCDPAHGAFPMPRTFVCQVCGSLVTVKGRVSSPLLCCGMEMRPFPGELW